MRIVSLFPSATEIVFALGSGSDLVGRSHECDHPPEAAGIPALTANIVPPETTSAAVDTAVPGSVRDVHTNYRLDEEALLRLRPDVVITQRACVVCVDDNRVEACVIPAGVKVVATDPSRLDEAIDDISTVGAAIGATAQAARLVAALRRRLSHIRALHADLDRPRVALLEWPDPLYAPGHWGPELIEAAGGENVFGRAGEPSQQSSVDDLAAARPDIVVIAFYGYGLYRTQARFRELVRQRGWVRAARRARVVAIDGGAYVSRPGPRLVDGVALLAWAFHRAHPRLRPPTGRVAELIEAGWVDLAAFPATVTAG